jgi:ABC-type antimicrobial peptide transport system permease subunit
LLRGRVFTESDTSGAPPVVIVNQAMAKRYWSGQDPIGQVIVIGKGLGPQFDDSPRQVIGIVGNVKDTGLNVVDEGVMYIPQGQAADGINKLLNGLIPLAWAIKTAGEPLAVRAAAEREIRAVDGMMTAAHVRTMEQMVADSLSRQSFNTLVLTVFAVIALLLAAIGIYGLMSYSVEQRMQEIGIRTALGATHGDIQGLMVRQGIQLAGIGIVIGLAAAYGVTRFLESLLFGVKARDPFTFGAVALMVLLVALAATMGPARRAAAIAPSEALRHQ